MVEARRPAGLARIDVEADIAVADRDRAIGAGLLRRRHPEQRLVEGGKQRIALAHDGNVVDLGEQGVPPATSAFRMASYRPMAPDAKSRRWFRRCRVG